MDKATAAALFSQTLLRTVFERVVNTKPFIRRNELSSLGAGEEIAVALHTLEAVGLIEDNSSLFSPTAKGMSDHRHLRQFEKTLENF